MKRVGLEKILEAVEDARSRGADHDVGRLLRWSHELLGERLMMSTAFGKSGMVLLHTLKKEGLDVPVFFLDTGFHFPETLEFFEKIRDEWGIRLVLQRPKLHGLDFVRKYGEKLYERDPDLCCHRNKVEPFQELFGERGRYQGWITGVRRDQSATRMHVETVEIVDKDLVKVQPLAHWTREDVEAYLAKHEVPLHPLLSQGYTSIGCAPCTRKNSDPTNERAGRWANKAKTECGLHTFWKKSGTPPAGPAKRDRPARTPATDESVPNPAEPAAEAPVRDGGERPAGASTGSRHSDPDSGSRPNGGVSGTEEGGDGKSRSASAEKKSASAEKKSAGRSDQARDRGGRADSSAAARAVS